MKKSHKFLVWFIYGFILAVATEITNYFVNHDLLSDLYICIIEVMFLSLGVLAAWLERRMNNIKKGRKK